MNARVGQAVRLRAFYTKAKVGSDPGSVTVDYTDESGNATTGAAASSGAITGERYYVLTPDAAGEWFGIFKSTDATLDQQHLPFLLTVDMTFAAYIAAIGAAVWEIATSTLATAGSIGKLIVDYLNASVSSRSTYNPAVDQVETGVTYKESERLILASQAGKLSGAPGGPIVIRDVNDTKNRINATVDAAGNRLAVTKDVT
jgi:hypothetical protein